VTSNWRTFIADDCCSCAESDPSLLTGIHDGTTHVVGLCAGLLPAAAAVAGRSVPELLDIGKEMIAIVFRLSVVLWRRALDIESEPGHWAVAVVNVAQKQLQQIIDGFNEDMVCFLAPTASSRLRLMLTLF
jgi:hypothetical protein